MSTFRSSCGFRMYVTGGRFDAVVTGEVGKDMGLGCAIRHLLSVCG